MYDPEATGFILLTDLEALILELANSDDACGLVVFRDLIRTDKSVRRLYIGMLKVPLYHQLTKVMFYDVLQ